MRQASAALITLLNSSTRFFMVDLFTFTFGGSFTPIITIIPASPIIPDTIGLGGIAASYVISMSDGSAYTGGPPVFVAPNFGGDPANVNNIYAISSTGATTGNIIVRPGGPGVGTGPLTENITLQATTQGTASTEGTALRYSAGPTALTVGGNVFVLGPKFERSQVKITTGVQVDSLTVKVYPETTDLVGGVPFLQALWQGQFDGAQLQLERIFMPTYGDTSAGTIVLFAGRVSQVDCARTSATISVKSHMELLNIQMPRRLWQPSCNNVFGDKMCTFDRTSLVTNFAAAAGSTTTRINGAPTSTVPYALGTIISTTGKNTGQTRTIATFVSGGAVTCKLAFLFPVTTGDAFQLLPGCDRTMATCTSVFNNAAHFGGFPFIPTPETAV